MIRTVFVAAGLVLTLSTVIAQSDPIAERRETMKGVGAATRDGAAIAKGEAAFDATKTENIFKVYVAAARKMPGLFPDTAKTGGESIAGPKIWEDPAGFKAGFAKLEMEATAAAASTKDLDSFRTAFGTVTKNCAACHEVYRIKK
ncbi:Cytochrome c, class II precursor [Bosea sp. LC85]|uniref:c-type cytochrome n=1 Tax=Bosea sp. LC85 TaxID=1502851 RepID=UPI0004E3A530|nr:cytochrome c [Bosea sp. LC85]KFC67105.1 Cytochrome c, class II precursor [Bosea sp. LC85]